MKYLGFVLVLLAFIKSIYYGIYEINDKGNKSAGIYVFILSFIGFILPSIIIFCYY